jgi:hypothetical protein
MDPMLLMQSKLPSPIAGRDQVGICGSHPLFFHPSVITIIPSRLFRTLFIQEKMKSSLLLPSSIVSYSHTDIEKYLKGRSIQPVCSCRH